LVLKNETTNHLKMQNVKMQNVQKPGLIRVGRCTYDNTGRRTDPSFKGFTNIVVMMKSHSAYGVLGPYELRDERGRILENIWQASKVYKCVPKTTQHYSRYDKTVIWEHPEEEHVRDDGTLTPEYYAWRKKLVENACPVRYPVGFDGRHKCLYALRETATGEIDPFQCLNYIQGRKLIYVPEYTRLVKQHSKFSELQKRIQNGENILIVEVDGPHQESLSYYTKVYQVEPDFIVNGTVLASERNLGILLNDASHPYGHGFCLAAALLDIEVE